MDCIFCKIIAGEIPSKKVYSDELCYAFCDIAPQAFGAHPHCPAAAHSLGRGDKPENSALVGHIFEVIAKIAAEQGLFKRI